MTFKYQILQNTSLNPYLINVISTYLLTDYQIASKKELLHLVPYKTQTTGLVDQLLKYKRFKCIRQPPHFTGAIELIKRVKNLDNYDDQFIWLHENGYIGCSTMNYFKLITKKGYKINEYLTKKRCRCWKGTKYNSNIIIKLYIQNNNKVGLETYFSNGYNLYRVDWDDMIFECKINDVDESIIDMIKLRM